MKIIVFCCHNSLDNIEAIRRMTGIEDKISIKVILLSCSSKIDTLGLLRVFEEGADGVLVTGCEEGKCQFLDGNLFAKARVTYTKGILDEIGLSGKRLGMCLIRGKEEKGFIQTIVELASEIRDLGENPLKKGNNLSNYGEG
ncbi:MAG: hydrogenase iron-sulfur subunit [bacterium]|nr:hydrogenase iron-sulfur subunit [bacterium]